MLRIKAFQGLRPAPELVEEVACVPYDVVNTSEALALASDKPNSLLHVDRAEIAFPPETNPYADEVYTKACEKFVALQKNGALIRETGPVLYLYQQRMNGHVQTGFAAVCNIEDYENDLIRKHEKTRPDKEDDRTRLIGTISADTGPVFLTYRDRSEIDTIASKAEASRPLYDFTAPDGIGHTVWRIEDTGPLVREFSEVPLAYVADGHHRTASAVRVGKERRAANPNHTGNEDYNWFLAVLFPAKQLKILPYNRVIKDLNSLDKDGLLAAAATSFRVTERQSGAPTQAGDILMYLKGAWYELAWKPTSGTDPVSRLDVSYLQDKFLAPYLGIDDPRTSKRIDFIGGIRGIEELVRLVDSGQAAVAFSMYPTTVDQLMDIADAGQIMPPKSTWFEPKLRSGLFIHTF